MELLRQHLEERPTAERSPTQLGEAVGLSRSTIWRQWRAPSASHEDELELRAHIQAIALEMRSYGYRPITAELHRRGVKVNHKLPRSGARYVCVSESVRSQRADRKVVERIQRGGDHMSLWAT